tara:strand:- start:56316 stop:56930 length:615 start_codon:yes stop_codon:yes gene_type:complete
MSVGAADCRNAYPVGKDIVKDLAIDIGANIGGFSMAYHNEFKEIIFFEANPLTYLITKENTKDFENVTGHNLAVSDESGKTIKLMNHINKDNGSVSCSPSITSGNKDWVEDIGVTKTTCLEDIYEMIGDRRINFLKVDCENSEYEILLGKDLSRIDHISMELHWQMGEEKYKELISYLSEFFTIKGDTRFVVEKNTILQLNKKV